MLSPSFFDDVNLENRTKFWVDSKSRDCELSTEKLIEGPLLKKCSSGRLKSRHFTMYSDRLVYSKDLTGKDPSGMIWLDLIQMEVHPNKEWINLISNGRSLILSSEDSTDFERWEDQLRSRCVARDFNSRFEILKAIGRGSFAVVYLARRYSDGREFAIKCFDKRKFTATTVKEKLGVLREIQLMRDLDHPNVIKLYEVFETGHHVNLVLELLRGGEMFETISRKEGYSDKEIAGFMYSTLESLKYLHAKGIMHRDIKPENLILSKPDANSLKLVDFGLASHVDAKVQLFKRCGTPGFVAPEILYDQPYDQKVDVFSLGCIFYILLTGSQPFPGLTLDQVILKNRKADVNFENFKFLGPTDEGALSLLKLMLEKIPSKRISAADALNHEWIRTAMGLSPLQAKPQTHQTLRKIQLERRLTIDPKEKAELQRKDSFKVQSPLINGRTNSIEEDKGSEFCDSPGLAPQRAARDFSIRKQAILRRAGGDHSGLNTPTNNRPGSSDRFAKSNPESPKTTLKKFFPGVGAVTPDNKGEPGRPRMVLKVSSFSMKKGVVTDKVRDALNNM